ncbi:MAG: hypothetical protein IJN78_06495 [Clostridia bacterium]|nr:hypothetical protein [Clostridia bacterium]MBQ3128307.1 hypothetical protein [Clostridia bacterium]MBQ7044240.1 hypothetical protein [Clostridia bacterium]
MSSFRSIMSIVMAFVLVFCASYFHKMPTTSAWFYDSGVIDSGDSFIFGDLSVDTLFTSKSEITFDGATKLADPEEILFDEVINVNEILVNNSGTIPARIYAEVKNTGNGKGLRWFFYDDAMLVDGSVKKTIESVLPELTDEALYEYDFGADSNSGKYFVINPGEIRTLKIATWIEYDFVEAELKNGATLDGYNVEISLIATQDVDGALER